MEQVLNGKQVAILVADGFEQEGMARYKEALEQRGARTVIVSASEGATVRSHEGAELFADLPVTSVDPAEFDALLLPAGDACGERVRSFAPAADLLRTFTEQGCPIIDGCGATGRDPVDDLLGSDADGFITQIAGATAPNAAYTPATRAV